MLHRRRTWTTQSYSPDDANVDPHLTIMLPGTHPNPHPKRHLDWFSRFAWLTTATDRQTDRPRYSVYNNRPHLYIVLRCSLKSKTAHKKMNDLRLSNLCLFHGVPRDNVDWKLCFTCHRYYRLHGAGARGAKFDNPTRQLCVQPSISVTLHDVERRRVEKEGGREGRSQVDSRSLSDMLRNQQQSNGLDYCNALHSPA